MRGSKSDQAGNYLEGDEGKGTGAKDREMRGLQKPPARGLFI